MAATTIDSLAALAGFADALAVSLARASWPPLLLSGTLGCGKTALTRFVCQRLPGGENAEIASPSFTICNLYPCKPSVMHCDFYRSSDIPDDVWTFLDERQGLLIAEWPGPIEPLLKEFLDISFNVINHARKLEIHGKGPGGAAALAALAKAWPLNS